MPELEATGHLWAGLLLIVVGLALISGGTAAVAGTPADGHQTAPIINGQAVEDPVPPPQTSNVSNETVTIQDDVQVDGALTTAAGEQTVIIEFGTGPSGDTASPNADIDVETLQSHAEQTQAAFLDTAAESPHIDVHREFWITSAVVATIDTDEVSVHDLARVEHVTHISENEAVEHTGLGMNESQTVDPANVSPEYRGSEWGLEAMNTQSVWDDFETQGEGVAVAVLDTGVNESHPEIDLDGWQEWDQSGSPITTTPSDRNGHGTMSSGLITGGTDPYDNQVGVAPGADHYHGKVSDREDGAASGAQIIAGIEWAVENDIEIVSLSYGSEGTHTYYISTLQNARQAGTLVISGSGNDGAETTGSPGNEYDAFAIGASTSGGDVAWFSSGDTLVTADEWRNPPRYWPDEIVVPGAVAPGYRTWTTDTDGTYTYYSGTSAATPHASGAAALLISATDEPLSPFEIRDRIQQTAHDLGEDPPRQGAGQVDAHAAALEQSRSTVEPAIDTTAADAGVETTLGVTIDHPVETYTWTFPDRTVTTETPAVTHTFETVGDTLVTVEFEDTGGAVFSETYEVAVDAPEPTAAITASATDDVEVGVDTITLDASEATDPNEIVEYQWAVNGDTVSNTADPTTEVTFDDVGTQTVSVTVENVYGATDTATTDVTVENTIPPTAALTTDQKTATYLVGESVVFNASATTDNHDIETYQFAFGDGTTVNTSDPALSHTYAEAGAYTPTVTAVDTGGNENTTSLSLSVHDPEVTVTEPSDPFVGTDTVPLEYTLSETAIDRVAGVEYRVFETDTKTPVYNWSDAAFVDTTSSESVAVETAPLETGDYTIETRLVDPNGEPFVPNTTKDSVNVGVRTAPPDLAVLTERADPDFAAVSPQNPVTVTVDAATEPAIHNETTLAVTNDTTTVATWDLSDAVGSGSDAIATWNGTTANGELVASGEYELVATTSDEFENTNESTVSVTAQTAPPEANVTVHDGIDSNGTQRLNDRTPLTVTVTANETVSGTAAPVDGAVTLNATTANETITVPVEETEGTWTGTVNGSMIDRGGVYTVTGTVFDAGKNPATATAPLEYNSAPHLVSFTPSNETTLSAGTDAINITATYEDVLSTVNTSTVALTVNNETISQENLTTVTPETLELTEYPVSDGTTYTAELYLEDETGANTTYYQQFNVSEPQVGGGGGGVQPSTDEDSSETFSIVDLDHSTIEIEEGEVFSVAVDVQNTGERGGQQIDLLLDGTRQASTSTFLDPRETTTIRFTDVETAGLAGEYTYTIVTDDDTVEGTIQIIPTEEPETAESTEEPDTTESPDGEDSETGSQSETEDSDEEIPGFGVVLTVASLLTVVVLSRSRAKLRDLA